MDIKHFRYFVAVAEALSFVRAARTLNMSQPPLSRRIAELEAKLGLRLFDRTSKKVELTPTGTAFLPHAREAIRLFDTALRAARSLSPSRSRQLTIALPPETSRSVLLAVMSRLQEELIEVNFLEAYTGEQLPLLASAEIDVGVLRRPFDKRGLRVSAPLKQEVGVIMDANHPLARVDRLRLRDLSPYPLIQFPRHLGPEHYDEQLDLCRAGGYVPPRILQSGRMTAAFLKNQSAVTLAPSLLLKRRGQAGTKEFIWKPLDGSPIHVSTSVVCRSDEWFGSARVAVDVIFDCLQQHENWVPVTGSAAARAAGRNRKKNSVRPPTHSRRKQARSNA